MNRIAIVVSIVCVFGLLWSSNQFTPESKPSPAWPIAPTPVVVSHLVIVCQPNCAPCDRVKRDFPNGFSIPSEYVMNTPEMDVEGTPTFILYRDGVEYKRLLGYESKEVLLAWLAC